MSALDIDGFLEASKAARTLVGFPIRFEFERDRRSIVVRSIETDSALRDASSFKVLAALADDHRVHLRIPEDVLEHLEEEFDVDFDELGFLLEPKRGGRHRIPCALPLLEGALVYVVEPMVSGSSVPINCDLSRTAPRVARTEWDSFREAERLVRVATNRFDTLCAEFIEQARSKSRPLPSELLHGRRRFKRYRLLDQEFVYASLELELACHALVSVAGALDDKIANLALRLNRELGSAVWPDANKDFSGAPGAPPMQDRKNCRAKLYKEFSAHGGDVGALEWLQAWRNDVLHREHTFMFIEIEQSGVLFSTSYDFRMVDPRLDTCVAASEFNTHVAVLIERYLRWFIWRTNQQVEASGSNAVSASP